MGERKKFNWSNCEMAVQKGQCQRQTPKALSKIAKLMLWSTSINPADVYSVTELSQNIKQLFSATPKFNDIFLKGEISNFARAASGHIFFNLNDQNCTIACVFFRHLQAGSCSDLGDGVQAVAMGCVVVYEPRSQYQLNVKKIIPIGDGISSLKLKHLKGKLETEGLFSQDRKKPIPLFPGRSELSPLSTAPPSMISSLWLTPDAPR